MVDDTLDGSFRLAASNTGIQSRIKVRRLG